MTKKVINQTTDLIVQTIESNAIEVKDTSINRIFVIDCSWSMGRDLHELRNHLKNNIPSMIRDVDTISIIWFASKGECGVLQEGVKVNNLNDIKMLNTAIDRWLKPVGLTGFKEPIELVAEVAERLNKDGSISTLTFMTDGYDNEWSNTEILESMKKLNENNVISATTIVEYGYYSDHKLLDQMAEIVGGTLVFDKDYSSYKETLMNDSQKIVLGGKRVVASIESKSKFDFVVAITENNDLVSLAIENGEVQVPTGIKEVFYLTDDVVNDKISELTEDVDEKYALAMIHVLSRKMKSNEVLDIIASLGDVDLYEQFVNCFSKQDYDEFQNNVSVAIKDESKRYLKGQDFNFIPKEDAFTVMELLDILSSDDNKFLPFHESFKYNKVSASRKTNAHMIDALLETLKKDLKTSDDRSLTVSTFLTKYESLIDDSEVDFVVSEETKANGFDLRKLVFNATRPNVSILIKIDGDANLPKNDFGVSKIKSFIYRNYTIVADGIKNVSVIPVKLSLMTFTTLLHLELVSGVYDSEKVYELDISKIPVLNRKDVSEVSAVKYFNKEIDLLHAKAKQKVLKYCSSLLGNEKRSESWDDIFGKEAVDWLKSIGLTSFNGFSVKTTKSENDDFYFGKELKTAIKSCSSLPSIPAVMKKLDAGKKLTLSDTIMKTYIDMFEKLTDGLEEDKAKEMLLVESTEAIEDARSISCELARTKMALIVGQTWFTEFSSIEENNMTITRDGLDFNCTAKLGDIKIKL